MNRKYKNITESQITWFCENYPNNGARFCSEQLNLPIPYLHRIAMEKSLNVDKKTNSLITSQAMRKFSIGKEEKYFKSALDISINSPEIAYTLGFLWGDGYLSHRKNSLCYYPVVGIVKEDFLDIFDSFKHIGSWKTYSVSVKNGIEQVRAYLHNNKWGYFLRKNDYINKSSASPYKILSLIPDALKKYWWRGYSDADGCFYIHVSRKIVQFCFCGSYDQDWSETKNLFNKLGIEKYSIKLSNKNNQKGSIIRVSNYRDIKKFGDFIYSNRIDIGLKRKMEKFSQINILSASIA